MDNQENYQNGMPQNLFPQAQYQQPQPSQTPMSPYGAPQPILYQQPQYQAPTSQYPQYGQMMYQPPANSSNRVGNVLSFIGFGFSMVAVVSCLLILYEYSSGSLFGVPDFALAIVIYAGVALGFGIAGMVKNGKRGFAMTAIIASCCAIIIACAMFFATAF